MVQHTCGRDGTFQGTGRGVGARGGGGRSMTQDLRQEHPVLGDDERETSALQYIGNVVRRSGGAHHGGGRAVLERLAELGGLPVGHVDVDEGDEAYCPRLAGGHPHIGGGNDRFGAW